MSFASHKRVQTGRIHLESRRPGEQYHELFNPLCFYSWLTIDHIWDKNPMLHDRVGTAYRSYYPRFNFTLMQPEPMT